jgi:hypothetical protein
MVTMSASVTDSVIAFMSDSLSCGERRHGAGWRNVDIDRVSNVGDLFYTLL